MEKTYPKILVMFSGGSDSTMAAFLAAQRASTVYMATLKRFGLFGMDRSQVNYERLCARFPETKFVRIFDNFEKEYREVAYHDWVKDLLHFGFATASMCGICKLGMHWKTIQICKEHDIHVVYDGAAHATRKFPEQNKVIFLNSLTKLYEENGILYDTPVYDMDTQRGLYEAKLTPGKKVKGTSKDIQPTCSQQILFASLASLYLSRYSFEEYEQKLKPLFDKKIDFMRGRLSNA
jgi:hypothetical protein